MRHTSQFIIAAAVLWLCVALFGCSRAPSVGGSTSSKAEKNRKLAEAIATDAAASGATAQARFAPDTAKGSTTKTFHISLTPKTSPRPGSPAAARGRVVSPIPYPTETEAEEGAIEKACEWVALKLAEQDPPVHYKPSVNEVKAEFLRKESRAIRPPSEREKQLLADLNITGNPVYVEYDVEISVDQIRELRSQERVTTGVRILGGLFALAFAGFLFLRADEWTKGYLTSWLALAAVMIAGAAAAALVFI